MNLILWLSGVVAIAGAVYFAAVVAVLHWQRRDVDLWRQGLSAYAMGPDSGLMTSAFVALSLSLAALAVWLPHRVADRQSLGELLLAAWGFLVVACFPAGSSGLRHTIHTLGAVGAFLCAALAARAVPGAVPFIGPAVGLATVTLFLAMVLARRYAGLVQRVVFVSVVAWIVAVVTTAGAFR